ncbi:MAG TPA: nuclear transport factor 2 family protein [Blastocatellia bacterium]|jgi:ketosteroid isomerase-like protein|nr:nuclear transport factor 2 family protein [Blastocatellia bacterium]
MPDQDNTDHRDVLALEYRFMDACLRSDTEALDSILAADFVFTDPDGINLTKGEWLDDLRTGDFKFESIDIESVDARVKGNVATVEASIRIKARSRKAGYSGTYSAMDIYERRGGGWQLTLSSASQIQGE